jgi:hypothetical protein
MAAIAAQPRSRRSPESPYFSRLLADHASNLSAEEQLRLLREVAEAVDYAHRNRVVHRGLTPHAVSVRPLPDGTLQVLVGDWQSAGAVPGSGPTGLSGNGVTGLMDSADDVRWWTWAGYRANATLAATLSHLTDSVQRFDDASIRMRTDLTFEMWKAGIADAPQRLCLPEVDQRALEGLKFNEALPERLATATMAARLADLDSAVRVLDERIRFVIESRF